MRIRLFICFVGFIALFNQSSKGQSVSNDLLSQCFENTFDQPHLNVWRIWIDGESQDSMEIVEAYWEDEIYYEIKGQSRLFQDAKLALLVDDLEKTIYVLPKSKSTKRRFKLNINEKFNFDTTTLKQMTDTSVFSFSQNNAKITFQIDSSKKILQWIETLQEANGELIFGQEFGSNSVIRMELVSQTLEKATILQNISMTRVISGKNQNIKPIGQYNQYEFINFFNE